jgi:hypothetical protein
MLFNNNSQLTAAILGVCFDEAIASKVEAHFGAEFDLILIVDKKSVELGFFCPVSGRNKNGLVSIDEGAR